MGEPSCHPSTEPGDARTLILKVLGVKRVAAWCGVGQDAVYQWLSRSTAEAPIPAARVSAIVRGAAACGIKFDVRLIWPDAPDLIAGPAPAAAGIDEAPGGPLAELEAAMSRPWTLAGLMAVYALAAAGSSLEELARRQAGMVQMRSLWALVGRTPEDALEILNAGAKGGGVTPFPLRGVFGTQLREVLG